LPISNNRKTPAANPMTSPWKKLFGRCAAGVFLLLLIGNVFVAVLHMGTGSDQTYRWVCLESGSELSYKPSVFGSARLVPGGTASGHGCRWELIEPRPPSP